MSTSGEESDWLPEARALVASAAALVRELAEEDVVEFERGFDPQPAAAGRDADSAERSTRSASGSSPPPVSAKATASSPPRAIPVSAPEPARDASNALPWTDHRPSLEEVRAHLGDCTRCELCRGRSTIVFGDGNSEADLMFIGEGPGEQEDRTGLPFVGRAGELLTQMIEKGIGIPRSEVYICNIVKCRPPQNRNPLPPEVSACRPFLDGQIRAVAPRVIVTLGKPAASLLLDREVAITRLRGVWQEYQGIPLMPTLHPAYVLRQYTPENRRAVWQDLMAALERSRA
jgi:DNA polymerase